MRIIDVDAHLHEPLDWIERTDPGLAEELGPPARFMDIAGSVFGFDDPSFTGRHVSDELEVKFGARKLSLKLKSGEELSSKRNLSAFVGSVYLPCRCGEVRAVFAPAVTRCEPRDERFR